MVFETYASGIVQIEETISDASCLHLGSVVETGRSWILICSALGQWFAPPFEFDFFGRGTSTTKTWRLGFAFLSKIYMKLFQSQALTGWGLCGVSCSAHPHEWLSAISSASQHTPIGFLGNARRGGF